MSKYETHFGLTKPPSTAHAAGSSVFVAPQVATAMAGLQRALTSQDAIVCITGPAGVGKTTIARRALEAFGDNRAIITVGRMQLGHDEVLELLLAGLGARQLPKSTVHRFALFRRQLQNVAEQDGRVFILVEDATRVGIDALTELEALTAEDAGVSNGANLILLGDDSLLELLRDPKMARSKQRIRSRQTLKPQSENELNGYLKHCFRLAGREFDDIFEAGCAATLHGLSDGLPRVVNNLVESALASAAEKGDKTITTALIEQVAAEEFGLTTEHSVADIAAAIETADQTEAEDDEIPQLIQDTLSDLEILAPELASEPATETPDTALSEAHPEPEREALPELHLDTAPEALPELHKDTAPEPIPELNPDPETAAPTAKGPDAMQNELPVLSSPVRQVDEVAATPADDSPAEARDENGEVPDWERDPTYAELRPDLDALERAMAVAQGSGSDPEAAPEVAVPAAKPEAEPEPEVPELIPEITLDKQIEAKIAEATEALSLTQTDVTADLDEDEADDTAANEPAEMAPSPAPKVPVAAEPPADTDKADEELEKIASELAKAKTLEDVDDCLAETLFGEEFSMMAAGVAANAPLELEAEATTGVAASELPHVSGPESSATALKSDAGTSNGADTSASQRLQVLRDLNQTPPPVGAPPTPDAAESIVMSASGINIVPPAESATVDPIEDQIDTSLTQTLRTLTVNLEAKSAGRRDDDDDEKKGFFSRFRRK